MDFYLSLDFNFSKLPVLHPLAPLILPIVLILLEATLSFPSFVESKDFEPRLSKLRDRLVA